MSIGGARSTGVPHEDELRKLINSTNPVAIRVVAPDDSTKVVAVTKSKRRASLALDAIGKLGPWVRLELLGKSDAIIAAIDNDGPATDLEDIGGTMPAGEPAKWERMAKIIADAVLKGQRVALDARDADTRAVMGSLGQVVREMNVAMHSLSQLYQQQVQVAISSTIEAMQAQHASEQAQAKDWLTQLGELGDAAPKIIPLIPAITGMLKSQMGGPKKGAPPTGPKAPRPPDAPPAPPPPNGTNGTKS